MTGRVLLEAVVIAIVMSGIELVRDVEYTGPRGIDVVSAVLSVVDVGGIVLGILVWREGGESVGAILAIGAAGAGLVVLIPLVPSADFGWYLIAPLVIAGSGLGLLVSQLNNYTLSPIS